MFADMRTAIPMAVALTSYFYFRPNVPDYAIFSFLAIWIVCFCLDMRITISNSHLLGHERNLVFPVLYRKMGKKSLPVQMIIEVGSIVIIAVLFENAVNLRSISVISLVFGISHLEAYCSNMFTVKKLGVSNP